MLFWYYKTTGLGLRTLIFAGTAAPLAASSLVRYAAPKLPGVKKISYPTSVGSSQTS
jgi:hypothetical protein